MHLLDLTLKGDEKDEKLEQLSVPNLQDMLLDVSIELEKRLGDKASKQESVDENIPEYTKKSREMLAGLDDSSFSLLLMQISNELMQRFPGLTTCLAPALAEQASSSLGLGSVEASMDDLERLISNLKAMSSSEALIEQTDAKSAITCIAEARQKIDLLQQDSALKVAEIMDLKLEIENLNYIKSNLARRCDTLESLLKGYEKKFADLYAAQVEINDEKKALDAALATLTVKVCIFHNM